MPEVREFIFLEADKPHRNDGLLCREALLEVFTSFDKALEAGREMFVTHEFTGNVGDVQGVIRSLRMHDEVLYASVEILDTPAGIAAKDYLKVRDVLEEAKAEVLPREMRLGVNAMILESKDGTITKLRILDTALTTTPQ